MKGRKGSAPKLSRDSTVMRMARKWIPEGGAAPSVEKVQEALEQNLDYFMNNLGFFITKYTTYLNGALASSPRATDFPPTHQGSPLVQRTQPFPSAAPAAIALPASDTTAAPAVETAPTTEQPSTIPHVVVRIVKRKKTAAKEATEGATTEAAVEADKKQGKGKNKKKAEAEEEDDDDDDSDASSSGVDEDENIKFPDNTALLNQLKILKREAYELGTTFDGIHDWIALNIPDMKEEDNVGVEVMGAVIEQVATFADTIRLVYGHESKYLEDRIEMEAFSYKYPASESGRLQLVASDLEMWDEIERGWRGLTRICLILHSVLAKNMEKLRNPRTEGHHNHMVM